MARLPRPIDCLAPVLALLAAATFPKSAALANPACGEARYCCDDWYPAPPEQPSCLFDVNFSFGGEGPTQAQRQAVLDAGGRIVHEFNLERIRAQICIADVPSLQALLVRSVQTAATDYRLDALIGIPVPLTPEDTAFLDSMGVQIIDSIEGADIVRGYVIDGVIPTIRLHASVRYVEENGIHCCPLLKPEEDGSPHAP